MIYCKKSWCCSLWRVYYVLLYYHKQLHSKIYHSKLIKTFFSQVIYCSSSVHQLQMDTTILSESLVKIFLFSVISKFGLNSHKSQIFFLAPTSARPVLVERFSGRFSYFRVNFNIHYLPFSVNCTFQTYTVQHLPFQSCNHNENTICT